MKHVTSSHNETFKHLKQLSTSAKHRKNTDQTLLEGVHLCEAYLRLVGLPLMFAYTDVAAENDEVKKMVDICEASSVANVLLGVSKFQAISSVENGVGIAFVIQTPSLKHAENLATTGLLLENIQDPGNMGAILRTAAAAGVKEIFVSNGSVSAWSPKVLRAGMGAHFVVSIYENCDLTKLIANSKIPVLATSLQAKKTIYQQDLTGPVAWLFGNEGSGVSGELMSMNVERVIIPQNPDVESLNVAAATAVCLFEQSRQQLADA